jgi:hypothetical protein
MLRCWYLIFFLPLVNTRYLVLFCKYKWFRTLYYYALCLLSPAEMQYECDDIIIRYFFCVL